MSNDYDTTSPDYMADVTHEATDEANKLCKKKAVKYTITNARHWTKYRETVKRKPIRAQPKIGRNMPCPCGSGKKFKRCHLLKGEQDD